MRFTRKGRCGSTGAQQLSAFCVPGPYSARSRGQTWGRSEENRYTVWGRNAARCKTERTRGAGLTSKPRDSGG